MSDIPYNHQKKFTPETAEDDPARAQFLDDLAAAKGREPFTYKDVLATASPIYERLNPPPMRPRRRR